MGNAGQVTCDSIALNRPYARPHAGTNLIGIDGNILYGCDSAATSKQLTEQHLFTGFQFGWSVFCRQPVT